eukprot:TRINITY_DN13195_c0_g1_i1.p1 TRINITY_DN13195_c0_g1~~TRINITY_DN13195_c0_g1_i1.p1  ORF type:complete len:203 (+),score=29.44 TRINITY_DN13195_c0_g1_i1:194-802(+)
MRFFVAVASAIVMACAASRPSFCHGLGCPEFDVLNKTDDYELRSYGKTSWVGVTFEGASEDFFNRAVGKGFQKCFSYISGKNEAQKKIEMTAPVWVKIVPGAGPNCNSTFTVAFFADPTVGAPPKPTDPDLSFIDLPPHRAFVTSFGGYATTWDKVQPHAASLAAALQRDGHPFEQSHIGFAGYDSPFRVFSRHNEVWLTAA